jgi:hypothetical protein
MPIAHFDVGRSKPMATPQQCAHPACECSTRGNERYCSKSCENAAAQGREACECGHTDCAEKSGERSIEGNQGEGNREADRRYREGATEFTRREKM